MKHGPIALVDSRTPSVFLMPQGHVYDKVFANVQEIKIASVKDLFLQIDSLDTTGKDFLKEFFRECLAGEREVVVGIGLAWGVGGAVGGNGFALDGRASREAGRENHRRPGLRGLQPG